MSSVTQTPEPGIWATKPLIAAAFALWYLDWAKGRSEQNPDILTAEMAAQQANTPADMDRLADGLLGYLQQAKQARQAEEAAKAAAGSTGQSVAYMTIAKADKSDADALFFAAQTFQAIEREEWPSWLNRTWDDFDIDFDSHCGELVRAIRDHLCAGDDSNHFGNLYRVAHNLNFLMSAKNALIDPNDDTLSIHPEIVALREANQEQPLQSAEWNFARAMLNELRRARELFPGNNLNMVALCEEVGELARALLQESREQVHTEATQVAAVAARIALCGDRSVELHRMQDGLDAVGGAA